MCRQFLTTYSKMNKIDAEKTKLLSNFSRNSNASICIQIDNTHINFLKNFIPKITMQWNFFCYTYIFWNWNGSLFGFIRNLNFTLGGNHVSIPIVKYLLTTCLLGNNQKPKINLNFSKLHIFWHMRAHLPPHPSRGRAILDSSVLSWNQFQLETLRCSRLLLWTNEESCVGTKHDIYVYIHIGNQRGFQKG